MLGTKAPQPALYLGKPSLRRHHPVPKATLDDVMLRYLRLTCAEAASRDLTDSELLGPLL